MNPFPVLLIAFLPALALGAETTNTAKHAFSATIKQGGVHEECVRLAKDESRKWEWSSDAALDFNIHYHEASEVFYPLKKDSLMKDKGTFKAKVAQDYCWMWTAKAPAKVEGRIY
jgi:hypothetical protein